MPLLHLWLLGLTGFRRGLPAALAGRLCCCLIRAMACSCSPDTLHSTLLQPEPICAAYMTCRSSCVGGAVTGRSRKVSQFPWTQPCNCCSLALQQEAALMLFVLSKWIHITACGTSVHSRSLALTHLGVGSNAERLSNLHVPCTGCIVHAGMLQAPCVPICTPQLTFWWWNWCVLVPEGLVLQ